MSGTSGKLDVRFAGVVTTAELAARGVSGSRIRLLVRRGVLMPVGYGAYAPRATAAKVSADPAGKQTLRVASVLAVAGPGDVGSHHSAAAIHGLDRLGRLPEQVAVTRPPGGSQRGRSGVHIHIAALPGEHVTVCSGVPVTSVARTVVDLARTSPFRDGVVVADSALRTGQASKDELLAVVADCAKWPGIRRARLVVDFCDGKSESVLESISRVAFRDHGIPAPELQVWVGGEEGGVLGRADFLWRRYRTIGEADGAVKYADTNRAISQLRRDAALRRAGFQVVHFTWNEINRVPHQVAASIRQAFRQSAS
jgi:predicted transcriptional regulator of viral defense system